MSRSAGENRARTIANKICLSGISLHHGLQSKITFLPSNELGIVFLFKGKRIPALAEYATDTTRGTSLGEVHVVEHVLSAIKGLGIDCILIELSANEPPAMDGSALPFVEALQLAKIKHLDFEKPNLAIERPIEISDNNSSLLVLPYNGFKVNFMVNFSIIGAQEFEYESGYVEQIAPARTFGYKEELDALKAAGRAFGASLETALGIDSKGYMNKPRFDNEPVRHKILDLIGDFALIGCDIKAHIIANKSGHKLNVEMARKIRKLLI